MIEICPNCQQVAPETEAEKIVATAKTAVAKERLDTARTAWEIFNRAHLSQSFWARNTELGTFISFCAALAAFGFFDLSGLETPIPRILLALIISSVVGCTALHFLVNRPERKATMRRKAIRNAFAIRYKESATHLGFRVAWK